MWPQLAINWPMIGKLSMNDLGHRCLSIDPGTANLGITISDYIGSRMVVRHTATLDVERLVKNRYADVEYRRGKRRAACHAIYRFIHGMVEAWEPSVVVSETPYMKRVTNPAIQKAIFMQYITLHDCLTAIRDVVSDNYATLQFVGIDPATAKTSLGIPGNSGDKSLVLKAILSADWIDISEIFIDQQTEHGVDSILLGAAYYDHINKWRI